MSYGAELNWQNFTFQSVKREASNGTAIAIEFCDIFSAFLAKQAVSINQVKGLSNVQTVRSKSCNIDVIQFALLNFNDFNEFSTF